MTKYKDVISRAASKNSKLAETSQPKTTLVERTLEKAVRSDSQTAITPIVSSVRPKNSLKKAALIFSRVHLRLQLRFETLFRAIAIYKACQRLDIPERYLLAVCIFLSMKYEEIYPAELSKVMALIKPNSGYDKEDYCKHEMSVLLALDGDLDLPTPWTIIDQLLVNQQKRTYVYAYYLLELSFISDSLAAMDFKDICLGVVYIMTRLGEFLKQSKRGCEEERVLDCAKMILKARYVATEHESAIYKKYAQEYYLNVSEQSIFVDAP